MLCSVDSINLVIQKKSMKDGTRRFRARSPDARYLEQDLHILGGPGVNMDALARVA